jgi:hypothetical protein
LFYPSKNHIFVVPGILWSCRTSWNQKTSKLIHAQTWCTQIHPNPYSDHNLISNSDCGVNPISVDFFYSTLSSWTTSQNTWTTLQLFKFKYGNLSSSIIGRILYLFSTFFCLQKWILWSYLSTKRHFDTTWPNIMPT